MIFANKAMLWSTQNHFVSGYADPTNLNFDATTSMYHQTCDSVIKELLNRGEGQLEVMFATHNEETLRYLFQRYNNGLDDFLLWNSVTHEKPLTNQTTILAYI